MECKICKSKEMEINYFGYIRNGKVGNSTTEKVSMYKCKNCNTMWHDDNKDYNVYYESEEYRQSLEGTSKIENFYRMHDAESADKFKYTGTEIFRNKIVADIGCGGGAFLDYINSVAKEVIAIEPSTIYQTAMKKRGFKVYSYAKDALKDWKDKIDVIVSFDCIEHVEDPEEFVKEAFELLSENGTALIGTPTDAPIMRELLGETYESFLFSTQHPWVLSEQSFQVIAQHIGIKNFSCKYYQRYGLGNCLYWLINKQPGRNFTYDFISNSMNELWKNELARQKAADYIVYEMIKNE